MLDVQSQLLQKINFSINWLIHATKLILCCHGSYWHFRENKDDVFVFSKRQVFEKRDLVFFLFCSFPFELFQDCRATLGDFVFGKLIQIQKRSSFVRNVLKNKWMCEYMVEYSKVSSKLQVWTHWQKNHK